MNEAAQPVPPAGLDTEVNLGGVTLLIVGIGVLLMAFDTLFVLSGLRGPGVDLFYSFCALPFMACVYAATGTAYYGAKYAGVGVCGGFLLYTAFDFGSTGTLFVNQFALLGAAVGIVVVAGVRRFGNSISA